MVDSSNHTEGEDLSEEERLKINRETVERLRTQLEKLRRERKAAPKEQPCGQPAVTNKASLL